MTAAAERDPVITGIGLISCLGEGEAAHLAALDDFSPVVDAVSFAPYLVHPMTELTLDKQIPKRGDQRQMEPWQRYGVYAAGLALDSAGVKGDVSILERMDMIVAAGGGERDYAVDTALLSGLAHADEPERYLNDHLQSDLRPTLFLAQLSNLLAGNISIVHGVIGSSRTFMGEEASGADALRIACARIAAGQSEICLVGGSYNAQRPDMLMCNAMGHTLWRGPFVPVRARQPRGGGMVLGCVGCFLVLESRSHATTRGIAPKARIAGIHSDRNRRAPGELRATVTRQFNDLGGAAAARAVISGNGGAEPMASEDHAVLDALGLPVRSLQTAIGNGVEAALPTAVAIAALCVARGRLFPPLEPAEAPCETAIDGLFATSRGSWRGEATALVVPA